MKLIFRCILLIITLFVSVLTMHKEILALNNTLGNNPIIPRHVLFGNPDKTNVSISNDGKYISYLAPKDGVLNIWLAAIDDIENAKAITDDKGRGIRGQFWAYDNRHILYLQDKDGDENFRLYAYDLENGKSRLLTPESSVRVLVYKMSYKIPKELLIGINDRDKKYFDVYKLNLNDYGKKLVWKNEQFSSFIADDDLNLRFATLTNAEGEKEYFQRLDNKWQPFMTISMEDNTNTGILGFDKLGQSIYMADSRGRNTTAIKSVDLRSGKSTLIAEDSRADTGIFMRHPTEKNIQAVAVEYDKISYKVLDNSIKADFEYLFKVSNGDLSILDRTTDDKLWLVAYDSDKQPGDYYLYDRNKRQAKFLFSSREDLKKYELAALHPVIIKARDGLNLVSYLTLPAEIKVGGKLQPQKPMPMVLYVHGGPWVRDSWGYNSTHQWLANRGYAVLSVNYRGSTGFGKNFINAANREWGGKMHDDLIDAVNWAVGQGIADPTKIAIMGGSYGGYATLAGLTMTPDVFACGVDIVGISNLITFLETVPPYWQPFMNEMKKRIGDWDSEDDQEFLKSRSPLTFAHRIKKPLLIAQGANDPRVKQAESDQIVTSMHANHIPVVYVLYEDEGHGFERPENRLSFYALTEEFLAKILKGRAEEIGKDLKDAKFLLNNKTVKDNREAKVIIDEAIYE